MKIVSKSLIAGAIALAGTGLAPLSAQESAADPVAQEEQIDAGLKNFGYIAGLSRGCVAEEQQTAFEKDVLDIYAGVSRLLGIDRAFLFSAAFGYGTSVEIERENCGEILEQYEGRATKFRSAARGE